MEDEINDVFHDFRQRKSKVAQTGINIRSQSVFKQLTNLFPQGTCAKSGQSLERNL